MTSLETGRNDHATSAAGGKVYVFGGQKNLFETLPSVECYDPLKNSWTTMTPLPIARQWHGKTLSKNLKEIR